MGEINARKLVTQNLPSGRKHEMYVHTGFPQVGEKK